MKKSRKILNIRQAMFQTAWRAISDNDFWIAATGARHARPLVMRNVRDFDNLPGVAVLGY